MPIHVKPIGSTGISQLLIFYINIDISQLLTIQLHLYSVGHIWTSSHNNPLKKSFTHLRWHR